MTAREELISTSGLIDPLLTQMVRILSQFEKKNKGNPPINGYEDKLRKFAFNNCKNFANLKNGSRTYHEGKRYDIDDMSTFNNETIQSNQFRKKINGRHRGLTSIIEWGHDHSNKIKGCINKPIKDFIKWRRLTEPYGMFKQIPLFCFQIVTDKTGIDSNINTIQDRFEQFGTLRKKWILEYSKSNVIVYIFLNYFDENIHINDFLKPFYNDHELQIINYNIRNWYEKNKDWPLGDYLKKIVI